MNKNSNEQLVAVIWNDGQYMSTRISFQTVTNTYYFEGYFLDISYNMASGIIEKISIDEDFNLNTSCVDLLKDHQLNLN